MGLNIDFDAALTDLIPTPEITGVPPREWLSKSAQKLYDARDAAYDKWVEADAKYAHLTDSGWERSAIEADKAAGRKAAADGVDPLSLPSALAEARTARPRVLGLLQQFVSDIRAADYALVAAVRGEMDSLGKRIEERIAAAEADYIAAQDAADAARQRYGGSLLGRSWFLNHTRLGLRTDYVDEPEATPRTAREGEATDLYGRPIARGRAEVEHINASYGQDPGVERLVSVRLSNGTVTDNVKESHASYLVDKGGAEYVDPQPAK
ncbi:hypothetical protein ABZT45_36465 [Streptomyces sp. NPDC005356]|uniref:hypothetical protein n=1 Tax=Streptomyces sp. NPDC005356 TaxID=3157167 RepID=UPI0033A67E33